MEKTTVEEKQEALVEKKKANELFAEVVDKAAKTGKKGIEAAANVLSQTADKSKELAGGLAKGAKEFSDKAKEDSYNRRVKKYNPLFREEYTSEEFFVPNIIRIVDDAVRRDIDVCKGAIGWREKKRGAEILFLYDEFVSESGLDFVPAPMCDEVYYIDPHDKKRFVKIDQIFQQAHEEKLAELEHIAYSLGAKLCTIEIEENEIRLDKKQLKAVSKKSVSYEGVEINRTQAAEAETVADSKVKRISKNISKFKGNDAVTTPRLKWFAHDDSILNLIEFRCKGRNAIESKTLTLRGSTVATMSRSAAASIDLAVMELGVNQNYSMEAKSVKENSQTIIYHLEF